MKWHKVTAQVEFYTQLDPNTDGPVISLLTGKTTDSNLLWDVIADMVETHDCHGFEVKGSMIEEIPPASLLLVT